MKKVEEVKEKYLLYMDNANKNGFMAQANVIYTVYLDRKDLLFIESRIISGSKMTYIEGIGIINCSEIKRIIKDEEED